MNGNFFDEEGLSSEFVVSVEPANEFDKHELFNKMKEKGLQWNAENKCVEKIEEPFEPKDGDFLVVKDDGNVFIYSNKPSLKNESVCSYCGSYGNEHGLIETNFSNHWASIKNCRYATEEEKQAFLKRLADEYGLMWDEKEKKTKRWRADKGEYYYFIDNVINVWASTSDNYSYTDDCRYIDGNYFKTKEACKLASEKIKKILKESSAV